MLTLLLLLPSPAPSLATISNTTYTNPVLATNCPDPGVLRLPDGSGFLAVCTSNFAVRSRGDPAFPLLHSPDLVHWRPRGHVFPTGGWPGWATENMWAPEVHWVSGRYVVYFTGVSDVRLGMNNLCRRQCITWFVSPGSHRAGSVANPLGSLHLSKRWSSGGGA